MGFDEAFSRELVKKFEEIALTGFGLNVEFGHNGVANRGDRARLLDELPDGGAYGVEAIVDSSPQVQDGSFALQVTGDLIRGYLNYRLKGHLLVASDGGGLGRFIDRDCS
jgi:hypothetical protein